MRFNVGPFVYALEISDQRPCFEGHACDGIIDFSAEKIIIFTGVRGRRRLNVLLHELRHAWLHHFPHSAEEEANCDMAAMYAQAAMQDLAMQGGIEALDALVSSDEANAIRLEPVLVTDAQMRQIEQRIAPLSCVTTLDIRRIGRAGRAECAICAQTFADGNIVTEPPTWHDLAKAMVVNRTLYCEGCNHLQSWLEGLDLSGSPSGVPVTEPEFCTETKSIEDYLAAHPEVANVLDYA